MYSQEFCRLKRLLRTAKTVIQCQSGQPLLWVEVCYLKKTWFRIAGTLRHNCTWSRRLTGVILTLWCALRFPKRIKLETAAVIPLALTLLSSSWYPQNWWNFAISKSTNDLRAILDINQFLLLFQSEFGGIQYSTAISKLLTWKRVLFHAIP